MFVYVRVLFMHVLYAISFFLFFFFFFLWSMFNQAMMTVQKLSQLFFYCAFWLILGHILFTKNLKSMCSWYRFKQWKVVNQTLMTTLAKLPFILIKSSIYKFHWDITRWNNGFLYYNTGQQTGSLGNSGNEILMSSACKSIRFPLQASWIPMQSWMLTMEISSKGEVLSLIFYFILTRYRVPWRLMQVLALALRYNYCPMSLQWIGFKWLEVLKIYSFNV